jgi:DNA-binding HxlR family transcriptional regulator
MKKNVNALSKFEIDACPFQITLSMIEGKWKFFIIYTLMQNGTLRFKELERAIGSITPRMLIKELKDLEANGIVRRKAFATVPPTVEYNLTAVGMTLEPIISAMSEWGKKLKEINSPVIHVQPVSNS